MLECSRHNGERTMGDRANVAIKDGNNRVYLYTHWNGYELPETLRRALVKGEDRWGDPQYLARVVFCEMVGDNKGNTGFGISAEIGDNSYPVIVVDCDAQEVTIEADAARANCKPRGALIHHSFAAFAAIPEAAWGHLDSGRKAA